MKIKNSKSGRIVLPRKKKAHELVPQLPRASKRTREGMWDKLQEKNRNKNHVIQNKN